MKNINHITNVNRPNFEKAKNYINAKTLIFLEQHKELLALMLEEVYFHNELIYWNWFSENGNVKTYEQITNKLAEDIDSIINKSYETLLEELQNSLIKYYDLIDPEKKNNYHQFSMRSNIKALN